MYVCASPPIMGHVKGLALRRNQISEEGSATLVDVHGKWLRVQATAPLFLRKRDVLLFRERRIHGIQSFIYATINNAIEEDNNCLQPFTKRSPKS